MASNEGDAVAVCAGASLGGKRGVFLCQNSGLTNATSPLVSLTYPFGIPILGFVSLRGDPTIHDEPQHKLMGQITGDFLRLMNIRWEYLDTDWNEASRQVVRALDTIQRGDSFFFVVRQGVFEEEKLRGEHSSIGHRISPRLPEQGTFPVGSRKEVLQTLVRHRDSRTLLLATTGYTGRELFEIEDSAQHFYMVGSMGCISSLGLGLAMTQPEKKFICIDGDGALLMRMGALPMLGHYQPKNLLHILLDNGCHDSTGGQHTVSSSVNFALTAMAAGYPVVHTVQSLEELSNRITEWHQNPELTFLAVTTKPGTSKNLARPSASPQECADRFRRFLGQRD